jgi:hypothetical protein
MSHRFVLFDIDHVTLKDCLVQLPKSLAKQVKPFLPPEGSFDEGTLKRYLRMLRDFEMEDPNTSMTLANRLRLAFLDMQPETICNRFPNADLPLKRRLRCVAEYLIRSGEFDKLRDNKGNLLKKRGVLGKLVVIYQPLPKMLVVLKRQQLIPHV